MIEDLKKLTEQIAKKHGLNPAVVWALINVESSCNTHAVRYEPNWRWFVKPYELARDVGTTEETETIMQKCSWGLMQVMGAVARELGWHGPMPKLCDPWHGIEYGCLKLKERLDKYPALPDALAAYNAGQPGTDAGKAYAAKVIAAMS